MDQFAIGMGAEKKAIYLDTKTLEYDLVPLDLGDNVIVIMNTNKRRELADSKYNERRTECEKAVEELNVLLDIKSLGELDEETLTNMLISSRMLSVSNALAMQFLKIKEL